MESIAVMKVFLLVIYGLPCINGVTWNITLFIGKEVNAKTPADFYLDINGTRNDQNGIHLGNDFRIAEQRTINVTDDFGDINSVRIYQFGDDALLLLKIMMSDGERQFTFTCDCWIQTDGQPSWILTLTGVHWEVKVYVGDRVNAGSKDTFYLDVNGTTNDKSAIELGYDFMLNEIRMIEIDWNFGDINSIRIYQHNEDGLFLRKVEMSSGNRLYTFQCGCWVQNNTSLIDSQSSWTLTETVFHWIITIYVGGIYLSESVDTFYLDINGTRNDMIGINLGRDYRANETRQFDIYWDFGEIISVRMFQHNDDGMFLEKIMMSEGERQFTFTCDCWIETDGQPSWILTLTGVHWEVKVYVGDRVNAGSKDTFYLDVNGTTNDKSAIELGYNFMLNEIRMIGIDWNFGDINSIRIYQNDDDGLFLRKVEMSSGNRLYTFQCGCWVQNNTSLIDSQSSWTLTETVFHWIITIYVGGIYRSESVDTFYLDINGTRNDMIGINLGRDYRANETRQFDIYWDFGEIISVRMFQHNDDGLFLEKIMMSEGERQFTFTCDCWIETDGQPSWILTLTGVHWEVKVYVGDRVNAGSKDTFYLDVNGTTNDKSAIELGYNFMLNEIRMIGIDWNFGDINSIRIYQNDDDGLFLRKVEMSSGNRLYTFQCGCWVQNNTSLIDSQSSWTLTETVFHWIITIYVGGIYWSESVDTFYLDINGTRNDMIGINLGRDYRVNETRQFDIYWDFGEIISVRMFQHNYDGLFLEKIVISDGYRSYNFTCDCWIQTDSLSNKSQPIWTLTTSDCHWNDTSANCTDVRGRYCEERECDRCDRHLRLDGTSCYTGKII